MRPFSPLLHGVGIRTEKTFFQGQASPFRGPDGFPAVTRTKQHGGLGAGLVKWAHERLNIPLRRHIFRGEKHKQLTPVKQEGDRSTLKWVKHQAARRWAGCNQSSSECSLELQNIRAGRHLKGCFGATSFCREEIWGWEKSSDPRKVTQPGTAVKDQRSGVLTPTIPSETTCAHSGSGRRVPVPKWFSLWLEAQGKDVFWSDCPEGSKSRKSQMSQGQY